MADQLSAPDLRSQTTSTASGSDVFSFSRLSSANDMPILVLLHGFPQSNYLWRKVIKLLPANYPVFIPDLPGYGLSTPHATAHDKQAIGIAVLDALSRVLGTGSKPIPIFLIGHDRGARVAHRLAVTFSHPSLFPKDSPITPSTFSLQGTIVLDTVPEPDQWASFASSKVSTGTYHWPFLANVELASKMILAYGGGDWCRLMCKQWAGLKEEMASENALDVYANAYSKESVVIASCKDYEAGAGIDVQRHEEDQKAGRKLKGRFMAVYSKTYLGSRFDLPKTWARYLDGDRKEEDFVGVEDGVGHFLPEEAPKVVTDAIKRFVEARV